MSGWTCVYSNDWYSQCLPGNNGGGGGNNPAPTPTSSNPSTPTGGNGGGNGGVCSIDEKWKARGANKKFIGVATDQGLLGRTQNADIIKKYFGQVTPENR